MLTAKSKHRNGVACTVLLLAISVTLLTSSVYAQAPKQQEQKTQQLPSKPFDWLNVIGLIAGAIGVIGTIYTIRGWHRSEQDRKILQYLFSTADKNLRKDITEEEIQQKRQEARKIAEEIQDLKQRLQESIPAEARRAVLLDKLFSQELLVSETYSAIQEIRKELGSNAPASKITPDLAKIIENEIRPEYARREQRSHLKSQLTIITTAAAILSSIFPDPVGALVSIPLFLLAAPVVLKLYQSYLPNDPAGRKFYIYRIAYVLSFLGAVGGFLYPLSLLVRGVPVYRAEMHFFVSILAAIVFLLCGLIFLVIARAVGRRISVSTLPARSD